MLHDRIFASMEGWQRDATSVGQLEDYYKITEERNLYLVDYGFMAPIVNITKCMAFKDVTGPNFHCNIYILTIF